MATLAFKETKLNLANKIYIFRSISALDKVWHIFKTVCLYWFKILNVSDENGKSYSNLDWINEQNQRINTESEKPLQFLYQ
jgi:hypothetical protein